MIGQTDEGRDFIAGEIIVATAIASYYSGGSYTGVLMSEIMGGLQNHNNVLNGVWQGFYKGLLSKALTYGIDSCTIYQYGYNIYSVTARALAEGVVGGVSSEVQGGDFWNGFAMSAASNAFDSIYQATEQTEFFKGCKDCYGSASIFPGIGTTAKSEGQNVISKFANNFGLAFRSAQNFKFWSLQEGGILSTIFNVIPGMNAVAVVHDIWTPNGCGLWQFVGTMPVAAVVTYGSFLQGQAGVELTVK